jgi:L-fucose isomerase-like protein
LLNQNLFILRINIAANSQIDDYQINKAINSFIARFSEISSDDFVVSSPDVIWFLTGGSEHNALKFIESQNKYCFIASPENNSWAAATEVKAYLNEKGINTEIFDLDKLETLEPVKKYLYKKEDNINHTLGIVGKPADWLIASIPDKILLKEVLNIETMKFSWEEILSLEESDPEDIKNILNIKNFPADDKCISLVNKLNTLIKVNNLNALALDCFSFHKEHKYTSCIPVAILNSLNFPVACEADLCSASGMIVFSRLLGRVPWMANINHVSKTSAIFSHCTAPLYLLDDYEISDHYETGFGASIKGNVKKQQVTIFRIDRKLEYCFISLGEVINTGNILNGCMTQAEIKMSAKSLFLLREFPLGNHHLIVDGDHSDILAEYFKDKGFRIV